MIRVRDGAEWIDGHADGVIRDVRMPIADDGLMPGAVMLLGDPPSGPAISMTIERRLYPRKAAVHMHKTDSFRMALNDPIVVGRTSYAHGEFRLQEANSYYGPEYWTDEVGTNQVLIMADRRGAKPYLPDTEEQAAIQAGIDEALEASDDLLATSDFLARDAAVEHRIVNNFGALPHAAHWDGGFLHTEAWPRLSDGTRLGVIAMGDPLHGPLLLCFDRPADAPELPGFQAATDVVRLVVDGSAIFADAELPRLGFRLQQAGSHHAASQPGPAGSKELWVIADRRSVPMRFDATASPGAEQLADDVAAELRGCAFVPT